MVSKEIIFQEELFLRNIQLPTCVNPMTCVMRRATDIKGYVGYTYLSGFTIHVLYTPYKKFWNIDVRYVNMLSNAVSIFNRRFLSGLHCYFNELIRKIILLGFREIINKRAIAAMLQSVKKSNYKPNLCERIFHLIPFFLTI